MTSKAVPVVALVSGLVIGARAHAQVAPDSHDSRDPHDGISDGTRQSEPTDSTPRVEGDVAAGTNAARHAELRASARRGDLDLSLAGGLDDRTDRQQRAAQATLGSSHFSLTGALTDTALDLAIATTSISTRSAGATWTSGRYELAGLDHELVLAACFTSSSGSVNTTPDDDISHMGVLERLQHSDHRFLEAYLKDTLHVIETLDVSGGFVFDDWRNLSAIETIRYGTDEAMDVHAPSLEDMHFSPQLGAVYRATDHVTLRASASREIHAPSAGDLYVPLVLGGAVASANAQLHPEAVWAGAAGPELRVGSVTARAAGFVHEIDAPIAIAAGARTNLDHARVLGVATEASWRPLRPLLATVSYVGSASAIRDTAFAGNELSLAPRHRGAAELAYDAPRIATVAAGVRWLGRQYVDVENTHAIGATTLVDATATRRLRHGLAGYVTVENLLDRRYVAAHDLPGAGRTVQLGVRVDSSRF